jgi:hypothetical protein
MYADKPVQYVLPGRCGSTTAAPGEAVWGPHRCSCVAVLLLLHVFLLSALVMEVDDFPGWRHSYDAAVGLRKQRLVSGGWCVRCERVRAGQFAYLVSTVVMR